MNVERTAHWRAGSGQGLENHTIAVLAQALRADNLA